MDDILTSRAAFNRQGSNRPEEPGIRQDQSAVKSVALIIDVQSFDGMSRDDAWAYSKALGQQIEVFRESGIEPVWVAIARGGSKLLPPVSGNAQSRDLLILEEMGFTGHQSQFANSDIYAAFINEFGPRDNETVYRKPSMSALVTPADLHERNNILEWSGTKLKSQKSAEDHPETNYIQPGEQDGAFAKLFPEAVTLHDYLTDRGVTDTHVLGMVSKYCVTETAISSATKGYNTRIHDDLVLSWKYPVNGSSRDAGQLVWADFDHRELIDNALSAVLDDPKRSYSDDQRLQIVAIRIESLCSEGEKSSKIQRNLAVSAVNYL